MHPAPLPLSLTTIDRTLIMGVVNVTPDSFSDGGNWFSHEAAVQHGLLLREQGADILDVGGESTRPGAPRVDEDEELRRVIPVITELASHGAVISVDTTRARVAQEAIAAGAHIINDVSGGLADDDMVHVAAQTGAVFVAMHWRGHAQVMDSLEVYDDVVDDVRRELLSRVEHLYEAGVRREQIVLDPGLGFSKSGANNWPLLAHTPEFVELGFPLLIGASRKRFLGHLLAQPDMPPVPPEARDHATAAITALSAFHGAWAVRVHNVSESADALKVAHAWKSARTL
ncbi:dihydropteroate synthase [Timonella sp. A28]|uniref:dihydropteroate synthase n=1 Tax=Timonella sp. A28 TaxID=3442640 RepID=UPI003EBE80E5